MTQQVLHPVATLAYMLNISERQVQRLAKQGIIPAGEKGQYPLASCMRGYIVSLQERINKKGEEANAKAGQMEEERLRLTKAQADRVEDENQVRRGQLIELGLVCDLLSDISVLYAAAVDALPGRLSSELTGVSDPAVVRAKLYDACRHVRQATAKRLYAFTEFLETLQRDHEDSGGSLSANPESVGG